MGDKTSYMLSREYSGSDFNSTRIKTLRKSDVVSLSTVSVGVLREFFHKVGRNPDAAALTALSEVLGLPRKTISSWFASERCKN